MLLKNVKLLKTLLFIYISLLFHCQFVVVVGTDLSDADAALLVTLYQRFRSGFMRVRPHQGARQFSVIAFNGAGGSAQALRPCPYVFINRELHQEPDYQAYGATNYLAATVRDMQNAAQNRLHAEMRIISDVMDWIEVNHVPATIHLFTYYSPCPQCAQFIQTLANILPNTVIHVGYVENDPSASQVDILESLSTLSFIINVRIGQVNVACQQPRDELQIAQSDSCSTHYVKQGICKKQPVQSNPNNVYVHLNNFKVGDAVEEAFIAPDKGRVFFNLMGDGGNVVLHVDARYQWNADSSVLVLNDYTGTWNQEERPSGFTFTPGKQVNMKVQAAKTCFRIFCNGREIACFKYRKLPITSVRGVLWSFDDKGATKKADLKSINIHMNYEHMNLIDC